MDIFADNHKPCIDLNGLNYKEKLQLLISIYNNSTQAQKDSFKLIIFNYFPQHLNRVQLERIPIERRIRIANDSLKSTDAKVSEVEGIEESDVYEYRLELTIVLYSLFKFNTSIEVIKDEDLEARPMFLTLKRSTSEKALLTSFYSTTKILEVVSRLPGLKFLIDCYIDHNSLEEVLIEFRIVDITDPSYPDKVADYDKAFRSFFFEEGESKGLYKLARTMTWVCAIRYKDISRSIGEALQLIYTADRSGLDKSTRNKYFDIRKVLDWILMDEFNYLEKQNHLYADIQGIKTIGNFDYLTFLERLCAHGNLPLRLENMIRIIATQKSGQGDIASDWSLNQPQLIKSKKIGYFFAYLENAMSKDPSEELELSSIINRTRNELIDSLSDLIRRSVRKSNTLLKES